MSGPMNGPMNGSLQGEPRNAPNAQYLLRLAGVSRAGFYRRQEAKAPARADTELRHAIHAIALEHRHYGHRSVTAQLRRDGFDVNRKRVLRLMGEDNLLALRKKGFVPQTPSKSNGSRHAFLIAPNLIRDLIPSGLDQIWVADITYIHMREEFAYLAIVLDAFSRRMVGWALEAHLRAELAIEALDMALMERRPKPQSLIHHSDRGIQYACNDYSRRLADNHIQPSMSAPGNPYHNAKAESFMKTLKKEEVNAADYRTISEARSNIGRFLETTYNRQRLHSALGYKPPVEFEADLRQAHKH
jgi:putative transposase